MYFVRILGNLFIDENSARSAGTIPYTPFFDLLTLESRPVWFRARHIRLVIIRVVWTIGEWVGDRQVPVGVTRENTVHRLARNPSRMQLILFAYITL